MDLASLMLALALFLIATAFVLRPILQPAAPEDTTNPDTNFLQARRASVLSALADLDFEHATEKIDRPDYESERNQLVADGVAILKQLDAADLTAPAIVNDLDARIEEAVAHIRKPESTPAVAHQFCSQCGAVTQPNDDFCAQCGFALDPRSESA
jgi:hypothetical protein